MPAARNNGIMIGIVKSLADPEKLGRCEVQLPEHGDEKTFWARIAAPSAGNGRGVYWRPEPQDEVLVCFRQGGDARETYILGGLYSKVDPPPADDGKHEENNIRMLVSRSGAIIRFDDTDGGEKIEIIDKDDKRRVVIDSAGGSIEVVCDEGDVNVKAPNGNVDIDAKTISLTAKQGITIDGGTEVKVSASTINLN